jgi:hypothetical protein
VKKKLFLEAPISSLLVHYSRVDFVITDKKLVKTIRMTRALLIACLFLTGCTSSTGPVVIRDVETLRPSVPSNSEVNRNDPDAIEKVQPVLPASPNPVAESPLKTQLIEQSYKKIVENDLQAAIVLAERGLRVDRKEPRFYEVLAQAYQGLANKTQSVYFAQQGLRYAQKGSKVYQTLIDLSK